MDLTSTRKDGGNKLKIISIRGRYFIMTNINTLLQRLVAGASKLHELILSGGEIVIGRFSSFDVTDEFFIFTTSKLKL